MFYKYKSFLIFLLFFLSYCTKDKTSINSENVVMVQLFDNIIETNDLDRFIDSVKYIPLESNKKSTIHTITRFEIVNNRIIIFDKPQKSITVFNMNGEYLCKIGEIGVNVNDYKNIRCFAINKSRNLIYIYDDTQFALLVFDFEGKFIEKIRYLELFPSYISSIHNDLIFFMNKTPFKGENYDLLFMDENKIKRKYFPFERKRDNWYLSQPPLYNFNEKLHYIDFFEGKVFEIDNEKTKLKYKIDFGEKLIPAEYTDNKASFNKHENKYAYLIGDFLEISDYLQFTYAYGNDVNTCLFAKNDGKVYNITNSGEWFKRIPPLFINTSYANENYLASAFSNSDCLVLKKFADELQDNKLKDIVRKMDVMSNPMIVIYYLK